MLIIPYCLFGASATEDAVTFQLQKAEERAAAVEDIQPKSEDVMLKLKGTAKQLASIPKGEKPCFHIKPENISLKGEGAGDFTYVLKEVLSKLSYAKEGECVGIQGINAIFTAMQNGIIEDGYVSTRVLVAPQDLSGGKLVYTLIPGKVNQLKHTNEQNKTSLLNAMPLEKDELLNLRDIEQGLENLRRVPTAKALMQITPSNKLGYSDILIDYSQAIPFRVTFSVDDAGSKSTGRIQGGTTIAWDNPLGLNDIFYFGFTRDLADREVTHLDSQTQEGGSNNRVIHYSIPWRYWLLSFNESKYNYEQKVAGASQIYTYSGKVLSRDIALSRVLYRDGTSKFSMTLKGWERFSNNFIDDAEITVQRRKTAGYEVGIDYRKYYDRNVLDLRAYFKKGTGARGALRAPEEAFGEGTSRMEIYTLGASFFAPFAAYEKNFAYISSLKFQYNGTQLTPQDKLAIGGRYTVRGFDGEYTLSGNKGWISRNELEWSYLPAHKFYFALDAGHVSRESTDSEVSKMLIGSALGLRGTFKKWGSLNYDLFLGTPIKKPDFLPGNDIVGGFSVIYSF